MITLLRILFGFSIYILLAFAFGRHLRAVNRNYPPVPSTEDTETVAAPSRAVLPVTLPQRITGILVHAMRT